MEKVVALKADSDVVISGSSVRKLQDQFNEFSAKVWFLENVALNSDDFHEKARDGYCYVFQSVLNEMREIGKIIDQLSISR
jgi:hypothetical protein